MFRYRHHYHIQDGSRNYFYLLELSRELPDAEDRETAQDVLRRNAFWANTDSITISMVHPDESREARRQAVEWVTRARREFDQDNHGGLGLPALHRAPPL